MRAIVQRVKSSNLSIDNKIYSSIKDGLLVFLGVSNDDTFEDADYLARKILGLRIFSDENDKMNLSVVEKEYDIMIVSQFTLYGDVRQGYRPSFTQSAKGDFANKLYIYFVDKIKNTLPDIKTGVFGADMQIELVNDGPVTIQLDSKKIY